jgi:hypothetical protein
MLEVLVEKSSSLKRATWYRWYALGVLVPVYTSSHVDSQIMGMLLEPIKNDLGASDTQMGFLIGLTFQRIEEADVPAPRRCQKWYETSAVISTRPDNRPDNSVRRGSSS